MILQPLSFEEEEIIEKITYYQEEFESSSQEDLQNFAVPMTPDVHDENQMLQLMTILSEITVCLINDFSRCLPWFDTITIDDQTRLMKPSSSEVMILRASRRYDIETDSIMFDNGQPYTREHYHTAGVEKMADPLFDFCKEIVHMNLDNTEFALLSAVVIFQERPDLWEPVKVKKIQDIYVDILHKYLEMHRTNFHEMFPRLLSMLPELHTLSNLNFEICFNLKVENKPLPGFLSFIWDIDN